MLTHHAGGQGVEEGFALVQRLVGPAVAAAQGQLRSDRVAGAELVDADVLPAEVGTVLGTEQMSAEQHVHRVGDRLHVAVVDLLHVRRQGQPLGGAPGQADAVVFRNVEAAVVGEQTFVALELAGLDLRRPGHANAQAVGELAVPAQAQAPAVGVIVAIVADMLRRLGHAGKAIDTTRLEALVGVVEADAEAVALVDAPGQRRGNEHLSQVDASVASAAVGAEGIALIVGVHAAVAVHSQTEGEAFIELAGVTELGDQEGLGIVAVVTAIGTRNGGTANFHAALGLEPGDAQIEAVAHQRDASRIAGGGQGILRQGVADAGHAEGLDPVAVGEVTVGGEGQRADGGTAGEQRGKQRLVERHADSPKNCRLPAANRNGGNLKQNT
ncbi:hypothetical protein D9M71_285820 [compost metagenome]